MRTTDVEVVISGETDHFSSFVAKEEEAKGVTL
jgi:hypothetical protein